MPTPPPEAPPSTSGIATDGSSSARRRAAGPSIGRPRSAAEEQRLSRKLRAEISAMRDAKLAALRETAPDELESRGHRPSSAAGQRSPRTVVGLDGRVLQRAPPPPGDRGDENAPPGPPSLGDDACVRGSGREKEISLEYADLLAFVAGESRTR